MGVTPQILSRAVTDPLARYIGEQLADTSAGDTWRTYLLRRTVESLAKLDPVAAWTVSTASSGSAFECDGDGRLQDVRFHLWR